MDYKTPAQIAQQYLTTLKTLKPEVNTDQVDSDWNVRGQVVGGVFSGLYADQKKISNDPFPQSARREGLQKSLFQYLNRDFTPATQSKGKVKVTGTPGSLVPATTQFEYQPNGNLYLSDDLVTIGDAGSGVANVTSVNAGQDQNLIADAQLSLPSPPAGVQPTAVVYLNAISDGRNIETNEQASEAVLRQIQTPLAGGKVADYEAFALAADPSVTNAKILRFPFGFGTVGVVITAGTTDIDQAIDNNIPVVLVPSDELVDIVQAYVETQNPITDCATVMPAASTPIDAVVRVRYLSGDGATEVSTPDGQIFTQENLVKREVGRAIYKTPPGGRKLGASGYVVAADIEEVLDLNLGADPYTTGNYAQILTDRQCDDLSASGPNRGLLGNQVAVPSNITVVDMNA